MLLLFVPAGARRRRIHGSLSADGLSTGTLIGRVAPSSTCLFSQMMTKVAPGTSDGMTANVGMISQEKAVGLARFPAWLWLGAGLYVLLLAVGSSLLRDSDTYWQIATGQRILDHAALPRVDIYSFTRAGELWMSSSWLSQVLYAASYNLAGWTGPIVLAASAITATFALLAYILGRRIPSTYAILIALAALVLSEFAFSCAPPRARAAGHGRVGERTDGGKRAPASAVMVVAAADVALGKPARRIRLWPRFGRSICV